MGPMMGQSKDNRAELWVNYARENDAHQFSNCVCLERHFSMCLERHFSFQMRDSPRYRTYQCNVSMHVPRMISCACAATYLGAYFFSVCTGSGSGSLAVPVVLGLLLSRTFVT